MTPTYLSYLPSPPRGVWSVGPAPVRAYALCIIAGIVVAVIWGNRRFVARGGVAGRVTDIAVYAVPFGLVGGRLYHVITDNELYFRPGKNPWRAFAVWDGGLGIWGAVALGGVGAVIGCRRYRVPFPAFADAVAPALVLAQAIGRLGNYFNQELFGSPTTLPWALQVFVRTPTGEAGAIPVGGVCDFPTSYLKATPEVLCGTYQPTFLYELLWNLGVAALVVWADRRFRLGGGRAFAVYVAGYTAGRTWIEMLRIDPANHFLGLRINVFTSILLFLAAVTFLVVRRTPREDPAAVHGPHAQPVRQDSDRGTDSEPVASSTSGVDARRAGRGDVDGLPGADGSGRS